MRHPSMWVKASDTQTPPTWFFPPTLNPRTLDRHVGPLGGVGILAGAKMRLNPDYPLLVVPCSLSKVETQRGGDTSCVLW